MPKPYRRSKLAFAASDARPRSKPAALRGWRKSPTSPADKISLVGFVVCYAHLIHPSRTVIENDVADTVKRSSSNHISHHTPLHAQRPRRSRSLHPPIRKSDAEDEKRRANGSRGTYPATWRGPFAGRRWSAAARGRGGSDDEDATATNGRYARC